MYVRLLKKNVYLYRLLFGVSAIGSLFIIVLFKKFIHNETTVRVLPRTLLLHTNSSSRNLKDLRTTCTSTASSVRNWQLGLERSFVPNVYRKDGNALKEYATYLKLAESPLPLQTKAVIILTNYRSGSSFFGELLNQHPDVFYVFEPLLALSDEWSCKLNMEYRTRIVRNLTQCIIPNYEQIYKELDADTRPPIKCHTVFSCVKKRFCFGPMTKELTEEDHCPRSKLLKAKFDPWRHCGAVNVNITNNICRRKKLVALKLIRACDINNFKEIVTELNVDLKILHLLRDPRGIANSRLLLRRKLPLVQTSRFTCSRQYRNAHIALSEQHDWLRGRYKLFRFEDVAIDPMRVARELFDFIGLDFASPVKDWIAINTNLSNFNMVGDMKGDNSSSVNVRREMRNPWSHRRDSKSVVEKWKKHLSYEQVYQVQSVCSDIMKLAGYLPVHNHTEYADKTKRFFIP